MRFRSLAFMLAVAAAPLAAQESGTIAGNVTSQANGAPIEGITVLVEGTVLSTTTNAKGSWQLTAVPVGQRVVLVRGVRHKPERRLVTVKAGETTRLDLVLAEQVVQLDEVVVTASREAEDKSEIPATVTALGRETIDQTRPHHPAELMNQVPGALVVDLGGEGNTMALRQPINYSPVYSYLEDGIPIRSTGFFNHNAMYEINMPGADRVEVMKGPGSALYGSDAIGGVVNSLTRPPSAASSIELFAEGGRFGYGRALASASNTWGNDGVRLDANITGFAGYRDSTEQHRQSGTVRWDHLMGGNSRLKTVVAFSRINSPGDGGSDLDQAAFEDAPTTNYTPIAFRQVRAVRWSTGFEKVGADSRISITPYARYNRLELLPSWQLTYDPEVWDIQNYSLGVIAQGRKDFTPMRSSLTGGVDVDWSPGSHVSDSITPVQNGNFFTSYTRSARIYDYDVTFRGISPYLQFEMSPVERVRITAGLRYDHVGYSYDNHLGTVETGNHRRPASTSVNYDHLSPKIGATVALSSTVSAFASYRHAFRAPSEDQLFRQGSAEETVNLQPVLANSYEIGVRGQLGTRLGFELSAYTMPMTNDILTFFNTNDFTSETSNAGKSNHKGIEVGATVGLTSHLRVETAYSYNVHKYVQWVTSTGVDYGGKEMESAPHHMANTRLVFNRLRGTGSIAFEWQLVGKYYTDPANEHTYDGYNLFNLYGTVPVVAGFDLVGRVNNLANTGYAVTASFNPFVAPADQERFTPGQPRTFFLGAQYRWNR
ncbi:MAG TPA: TonB-dependent receptor [Gemmatimonadales bacterium]|nr:TonB-dependent receptor [Gemmatimonadales bacterium]